MELIRRPVLVDETVGAIWEGVESACRCRASSPHHSRCDHRPPQHRIAWRVVDETVTVSGVSGRKLFGDLREAHMANSFLARRKVLHVVAPDAPPTWPQLKVNQKITENRRCLVFLYDHPIGEALDCLVHRIRRLVATCYKNYWPFMRRKVYWFWYPNGY